MNNNIERYLNDICSFIKNKDVHEEVSCEIREHIYDIVDEYMEEGLNEEEAINKALIRMGSAEECGVRLNKIHKAAPDYISIGLTAILTIITLITMISLAKSNILGVSLVNNVIGILIGSAIAIGLYFFDYRKLKKFSYPIYGASIIILLLNGINILGSLMYSYNSSSMFLKLSIIILLLISISGIINSKRIDTIIEFLKVLCIVMIPNVFIILGYSHYKIYSIYLCIVYLCGINAIFIISNIKKSFKIIFSLSEVIFLIIISILVKKRPYIISLFTGIINPESNPNDAGYIAMSVRKVLINSSLFGNSTNNEMVARIPLVDTDLTLSYIIYRFGIIAGLITILIVAAFIIRIFSLKSNVKDNYGKSIIVSITTVLLAQIIFSVMGNLGIISISFTLPFISCGVMNLAINISLVGLISSIYRRRNLLCIS